MTKTINLTAIHGKKAKKLTQKDSLDNGVENTPVTQIFLGEYLNVHTFKMHPITAKFLEQECVRLVEWANQEDSLLLVDFIDMRGYSPEIFSQWCEKHYNFEAAHQYALRRIGSRRETGAIFRKFAESTVHRTLGHYSKIWRDETILAAKLREDTSKQNDIKIVIEEMPWQPGPMAPCMLDAVIEPKPTPEEVAGKIHKLTTESRCEGAGQYVARYKVKEQK